jgi:hypothetical protein
MSLSSEFEKKVSICKKFIQANWPLYRSIAAAGYAKVGRGAIVIDLDNDFCSSVEKCECPYLNEVQLKKRVDPLSILSILIRLNEYNPEREILFTFFDFKSLDGQAIILGERKDGVPCGRNFEKLPQGTPTLGEIISPIVTDRPDSDTASNYDNLLEIINDTVTRSDEDALNNDERAIWDIGELQYQVENGGFDQFFSNCETRWKHTANALRRVGATRMADLFDQASIKFLNRKPPQDDDWLVSKENLWDSEDSEFYKLEEELPEIIWHFWKSRKST